MSATPITQDDRDVSYVAVEGQTEFAVTYKFQVDSDLVVSIVAEDDSETVLTLNVDYTVSGAGEDTGGTITLLEGAVEGTEYRIRGEAKLVLYQKLTSANYSRATINTIFERCLIWITETLSKINVVQTAFDYFNSTTVPAIEQIRTDVDESLSTIKDLEESTAENANASAESAEAASTSETNVNTTYQAFLNSLSTLAVEDLQGVSPLAVTLMASTSELAMRNVLEVYSKTEVENALGEKLDGKTYASRAAAVSATVPAGITRISVKQSGGYYLDYREDTSTSNAAITSADSRKWVPYAAITPNHWVDNATPGTTDMAAALQSASNYAKELTADASYYEDDRGSLGQFRANVEIVGIDGEVYGMTTGFSVDRDNRTNVIRNLALKAIAGSWAATDFMLSPDGDSGSYVTVKDISFNCNGLCSGLEIGTVWYVERPVVRRMAVGGKGIEFSGSNAYLSFPVVSEWTQSHAEFFDEDNYGAVGLSFNGEDNRVIMGAISWCSILVDQPSGGGVMIGTHLFNGMENFGDYNKDGTTIADNPSGTPATGRANPIGLRRTYTGTDIKHIKLFNIYFDNCRNDIYDDRALVVNDCYYHSNSDHSNADQTVWFRFYAWEASCEPSHLLDGAIAGVKTRPKKLVEYLAGSYSWAGDTTALEADEGNLLDTHGAKVTFAYQHIIRSRKNIAQDIMSYTSETWTRYHDSGSTKDETGGLRVGSVGDRGVFRAEDSFLFRNAFGNQIFFLDYANSRVTGVLVQSSQTDITAGKLARADYVVNDQPIAILAIGQSNMASTVDQTGGDQASDSRVFFWDCNSSGDPVDGTQFNVATFGTPPLARDDGAGGYANNLAFQTAKALRKKTGRSVYVVMIARGAHNIESWISGDTLTEEGWTRTNYDLYSMMNSNVSAALAAIPGSPSTFDAVIVHQGENNASDGTALYAQKLGVALDEIAGLGCIDLDKTHIILGELAEGAGTDWVVSHSAALGQVANGEVGNAKNVSIVPSSGLSKVNTLHFSGLGLVQYGQKYAASLMSETSPQGFMRWGIGDNGTQLVDTDAFDNITASGIYAVSNANASTVGAPSSYGGTLLAMVYGASYQTQLYIETLATGRVFKRYKNGGTWSGWKLIYSQDNIVGTVSGDESGNPTGAAFESGGDISTGYYRKYADGSMICVVRGFLTAASAEATWDYGGQTFIENPAPFVSCRAVGSTVRLASVSSLSTASMGVVSCDITGDYSVTPAVDLRVEGRWR